MGRQLNLLVAFKQPMFYVGDEYQKQQFESVCSDGLLEAARIGRFDDASLDDATLCHYHLSYLPAASRIIALSPS